MKLGCANCNGCNGACGMGGLGFDPTSLIAPIANKLLAPGSGGGTMPGTSSGTAISTAVQTQVSPQISPVFVQQDQPQNSPVNATPYQSITAPQSAIQGALPGSPGTIPQTGYLPGFDNGSGYAPTGLPLLPSQPSALNAGISTPVLIGAAGLLMLAIVLPGKKKRKGKR